MWIYKQTAVFSSSELRLQSNASRSADHVVLVINLNQCVRCSKRKQLTSLRLYGKFLSHVSHLQAAIAKTLLANAQSKRLTVPRHKRVKTARASLSIAYLNTNSTTLTIPRYTQTSSLTNSTLNYATHQRLLPLHRQRLVR